MSLWNTCKVYVNCYNPYFPVFWSSVTCKKIFSLIVLVLSWLFQLTKYFPSILVRVWEKGYSRHTISFQECHYAKAKLDTFKFNLNSAFVHFHYDLVEPNWHILVLNCLEKQFWILSLIICTKGGHLAVHLKTSNLCGNIDKRLTMAVRTKLCYTELLKSSGRNSEIFNESIAYCLIHYITIPRKRFSCW